MKRVFLKKTFASLDPWSLHSQQIVFFVKRYVNTFQIFAEKYTSNDSLCSSRSDCRQEKKWREESDPEKSGT